MNLYEELDARGMLYQASEGLETVLAERTLTAYIGFDPTAASLHVGSLLPVMALVHLQRHGHSPIAIVGGGTGMIGDPGGKAQERPLLSREQIEHNVEGIRAQLERFLDFATPTNPARLLNNADWLAPISLLDFLRDVGKHFTVNYMLAKESVERRIAQEEGISFTEFSYMLLQAYDFLTLYDRYGCTLQLGGSDQWGNIVAGCELIRRVRGGRAHALVMPLVTDANGNKFGKTEAGAVWLDPELTSPFRFYQFWLNTDDRDVVRYLRYFTLRGLDEIEALAASVRHAPERRDAQRALASDVTRMLHGEDALRRAERASRVLFGGDLAGFSARELQEIFADVPSARLPRSSFEGEGMGLVDLLVAAGSAASKGEARRLIQGGGCYLNNRRVADVAASVPLSAAIDGSLLVLRKGARDYRLVQVEG